MSSNRPRHMHGPGGYGQAGAGEKAKDLKKTGKKLLVYMGRYKIALVFVLLFAIAGTVFTIVGPKILGNATTELYNGLISMISGGEGINFGKIAEILLFLLGLFGLGLHLEDRQLLGRRSGGLVLGGVVGVLRPGDDPLLLQIDQSVQQIAAAVLQGRLGLAVGHIGLLPQALHLFQCDFHGMAPFPWGG